MYRKSPNSKIASTPYAMRDKIKAIYNEFCTKLYREENMSIEFEKLKISILHNIKDLFTAFMPSQLVSSMTRIPSSSKILWLLVPLIFPPNKKIPKYDYK